MATRVEALVLDLGNVLVFHDNAALFRRFAQRAGRSDVDVLSREILDSPLWDASNRGHCTPEELRRGVCALLGVDLPAPEFFELWSSHFTPYQAMFEVVERLVGRVKLLLLSNTNQAHFEYVRPRTPILERFDSLVLSYELGLVKPEPAIFQEAIRRAGTLPERAAFFDDIRAYAEAASAVGMQGRVFTTVETFEEQLAALGL